MATLHRRAWRELTRRRARSFFTVVTIAAAVVGLWLFAVPALVDDAMTERADRDLLWDLRLAPDMIELSRADVAAIRDLPNVAGVEARVVTTAEAFDQGRTTTVLLVSVDAFVDQEVNAVRLLDGAIPNSGEVLADPQNVRSGRFLSGLGDTFTIGGAPATISGVASSLEWTAYIDDNRPVFYLQLDRLQAVFGAPVINWLDVRIDDPAAADATAAAIGEHLESIDPAVSYWEPLRIRQPGWWPEQEQVNNIVQLMYVIAGLGIISASFMVFTTMNTIVREQTREIAVIKAVGGTRARILRSYLLSAGALGAIGTALGVEDKATALIDKVGGELEAARQLTADIAPRKRVLFVLSLQGGKILAAGADTAASGIVALAGAENAVSGFEGYKQLTDEAVIEAQPDVVLMMARGDDLEISEQELFAHPAIAQTPVGTNRQLVRMDGLYLLGFGPRTAAAARDLALRLYGDRVSN